MTSREIDKLVSPIASERKTESTSLSFSFGYFLNIVDEVTVIVLQHKAKLNDLANDYD